MQDYRPRYVFVAGSGLYHRAGSECAAPISTGAVCYSDSQEGLIAQGILPCPLCCPLPPEEVWALRERGQAKLSVDATFAVDPEEVTG